MEFSAPDLITNPGTAPAQPKIRIEGEGDFTVTVGFCTMAFEGVDGGIVVDTEAMECLDLSETQLRNGCAQMEEFPTLPVGVSGVTWTGDVSRIVIMPRWRFI